MGTEIRTWQIVEGELQAVLSTLKDAGRTEPYDLEPWIASNPDILGPDVMIIGRQVSSRSGPIDLLAVDRMGNTVVVELKRGLVPREALAQAIDYASDVASWSVDRLDAICNEYTKQGLDDRFAEAFGDDLLTDISFNETQRIVLVGFAIESSLERMVEWLSDKFGVAINAVVLSYCRTTSGDELLSRTAVISEETELRRVKQPKRLVREMSDEPGTYSEDELRAKLLAYLQVPRANNLRVREVLLPELLKRPVVTREQLMARLVERYDEINPADVGYRVSAISTQLGAGRYDFLRQIIAYERPAGDDTKDNYRLRDEQYRGLVSSVLAELGEAATTDPTP